MKYFSIGVAQKGLGDDTAARTGFLKAKGILEEQLKQQRDDADLRVQLAKVLAWLGEKDARHRRSAKSYGFATGKQRCIRGPNDN